MNVVRSVSIVQSSPGDLRRKRSREFSDALLQRAQYLPPEDRCLIQAIYRDHLTALEVATLTGLPVRPLRRRARHLVERMVSPVFAHVMRSRDHWPAHRRRVADAVVLDGRTWRSAANFLRTSLHSIRREMEIIAALANEQPSATAPQEHAA